MRRLVGDGSGERGKTRGEEQNVFLGVPEQLCAVTRFTLARSNDGQMRASVGARGSKAGWWPSLQRRRRAVDKGCGHALLGQNDLNGS